LAGRKSGGARFQCSRDRTGRPVADGTTGDGGRKWSPPRAAGSFRFFRRRRYLDPRGDTAFADEAQSAPSAGFGQKRVRWNGSKNAVSPGEFFRRQQRPARQARRGELANGSRCFGRDYRRKTPSWPQVMDDSGFNHFNVFAGRANKTGNVVSHVLTNATSFQPHAFGKFRVDPLGPPATEAKARPIFVLSIWIISERRQFPKPAPAQRLGRPERAAAPQA